MKVIAMIPARYEASRFPGKLMKDLCGKSVILRTYEATLETHLFDEVFVVTDSDVIYNEITKHGGKAIKSEKEHECGSDRIAEAVERMQADIVINVQGDEPFTNQEVLKELIEVFKNDTQNEIDLASVKTPLKLPEEIENPNNVKVITDLNETALYFSRSPIPFHREQNLKVNYYKHIGIYAFRKQALMEFYHQNQTPLEAAEKIECIRYLEHGKKIKMITTTTPNVGIDTPEDLERAKQMLKEKNQ
ncbi:MAG: 3-deoxy-manno-octulosonate cytidylyltransferase [Flavobacteriaceae bacterium]|nr:3-deoxy-manno-octulosonate cytidylyltransferase [Flavobacteriaceae bacterium]